MAWDVRAADLPSQAFIVSGFGTAAVTARSHGQNERHVTAGRSPDNPRGTTRDLTP